MEPLDWITRGEVGISSKTIWAVMVGAEPPKWCSVPYDPDDFSRCWKLLALFPDWKSRLGEVADRHPSWGPMVERWDEMERLWLEESPAGECPKLYALMRELIDEGRRRDGWRQVRPGYWRKEA